MGLYNFNVADNALNPQVRAFTTEVQNAFRFNYDRGAGYAGLAPPQITTGRQVRWALADDAPFLPAVLGRTVVPATSPGHTTRMVNMQYKERKTVFTEEQTRGVQLSGVIQAHMRRMADGAVAAQDRIFLDGLVREENFGGVMTDAGAITTVGTENTVINTSGFGSTGTPTAGINLELIGHAQNMLEQRSSTLLNLGLFLPASVRSTFFQIPNILAAVSSPASPATAANGGFQFSSAEFTGPLNPILNGLQAGLRLFGNINVFWVNDVLFDPIYGRQADVFLPSFGGTPGTGNTLHRYGYLVDMNRLIWYSNQSVDFSDEIQVKIDPTNYVIEIAMRMSGVLAFETANSIVRLGFAAPGQVPSGVEIGRGEGLVG